MRRRPVPVALAAAAYTLLTAALTWPLILHPGSLVPSDLGDPLLNTWILWWNARTVPLTAAWWNAPQFYPFQGALGLSEHLLGLAPITTPVILLTGNPLLAYNAAFFLAFVFSGLAAHFLVFTITRRHDLSFVAGLAFSFAPYRLPQIAHVQVLSAYWMPLALAGLHRYFDVPPRGEAPDRRRTRWLLLFAGAWFMQALACGYYFFFLSVLVGIWLAWFGLFRGRTAALARALLAWAVAGLLLAPVFYGYWRISRAYNLKRTMLEIRQFSADIASILKGSDLSLLWSWLDVVTRPESDLFPGLTLVVLAACALVVAWRIAARGASGHPRTARVLVALGAVAAAVSIARSAYGPFRLEIGGLRLLSVTSPEKPVSVAALCFVAAALLHPAIRAAWRRQSSLAFYALATVAMWLMALGPAPTLMNAPAIYKAPYAWLMLLPGADGVRVPARFWMLGVLCLSVTAALGLRLLIERWPRTARWLPAVALAGIIVDDLPRRLPMAVPPELRPSQVAADLRLDLPLGDAQDTQSLYRAMQHGRPLINGYSGYFAPHYWVMKHLLAQKDAAVIPRLSELGSIEITVDHALDPDGTWRQLILGAPSARLVQAVPAYTTYVVDRRGRGDARATGTPVPFTVPEASINVGFGPLMQDGNLYTRWHAGREQWRGDWVMVDVGSPMDIKGVEMLIGGYVADYPRELRIETSVDQQAWTTAWAGPTALLALSGALERPRDMPLSIPLEPRPARYVRFTQTGTETVYYWSIAELRILR